MITNWLTARLAIYMYVVALVNCISFEEGEEMNKVTDAVNQTSYR